MPRFSINTLPPKQQTQLLNEFYDTIASLKGRDEVQLFFRDLLTLDEIAMLMRRIEVAALLRARFSYEQITEILGVGKPKITNVQRSLQKDESGYDIVIQRLLQTSQGKARAVTSRHSEYERLKRIPYSGLYIFHIMDEIGALLKDNFDDKPSGKEQEIISRMPSRKINRPTD